MKEPFGNLLADGLVEEWDHFENEKLGDIRIGFPKASRWILTEKGRHFAQQVLGAERLDDLESDD